MSIHLNRKKILCVSFFLCCVLPACFTWFESNAASWSGLSLLELPLLIGTMLYAFALLFDRTRYVLSVGIFSHVLLLAFFAYCFVSFPMTGNLALAHNLSLSLETARPAYWIALALLISHLALFTTTEIAVQKLSRQTATQNHSES